MSFKILMVPLTGTSEAEIHGMLLAGVTTNPEYKHVKILIGDKTEWFFWYLANQFGIYQPSWKVTKPGTRSITVDTMTPDDWAVFTQYFDFQKADYFTDGRYVGYTGNMAQDSANIARQIDMDAYNGVFKPYLEKV